MITKDEDTQITNKERKPSSTNPKFHYLYLSQNLLKTSPQPLLRHVADKSSFDPFSVQNLIGSPAKRAGFKQTLSKRILIFELNRVTQDTITIVSNDLRTYV